MRGETPHAWASHSATGEVRLGAILFDPGSVTELASALTSLCERLRQALRLHAAAIVTTEDDPSEVTAGMSFLDPDSELLLRPLLGSGGDLGGLVTDDAWDAPSHRIENLAADPAVLDRLRRLVATDAAPPEAAAALDGASAVIVPLATRNHPRLGCVALLSLDPARPLDDRIASRVEDVAAQLSLTVRNHQLRDRNRRIRQVLEAVLESDHNGVIVTDLSERLTLANRAASQLVAVDLTALVGQPIREIVAERLRWRFSEPAAFVRTTTAIYDDPEGSVADELRTVDGRVIERYSAPVRDTSGALLGRVHILSDVTAARDALEVARAAAEEAAQLRLSEERRAQEQMALARAAHLMASALTRADIHEHLLEQAVELSGADVCGIMVLETNGELVAAAVRGITHDALERMGPGRADDGMAGRALTVRRALICGDVDAEGVRARGATPRGVRSFIHVPLLLGERPYGLLTVGSGRPRAFGERELRLLGELARDAGSALQNATQFEQERHIAETLQRALLPDDLPTVPGLAIAGLYRAAAGSQVGGDFYGVWRLPAGEVAVLVGDVSGKGVEAAGTTAMVRYVAEGLSAHERDPGRVITDLNDRIVDRVPDGSFVTLVMAVIDPGRNEMAWCNAGHVAPLLVSASGALRALTEVEPPCGAFRGERYTARVADFEPGDTLVCHTDGLVEARRDGEDFGDERVRAAVREHIGASPRDLARAVYAAVGAWTDGRITDDVAIAVVKRTAR